MAVITAERLVQEVKKRAAYDEPVTDTWNGIEGHKGRFGYVLGGQGELYTRELAERWGRAQRSGRSYAYFTQTCAHWIGGYIADCSGLIVEAIRAVKSGYADRSANGMKGQFAESGAIGTIPEQPGIAVWKSGHIGIYIGGGLVVEARGAAYGVVVSKLNTQRWTLWGKLRDVEYKSSTSGPAVRVTGETVNVRSEPDTASAVLGIARKGDMLERLNNGWYKVNYGGKTAYISARGDLTEVVR